MTETGFVIGTPVFFIRHDEVLSGHIKSVITESAKEGETNSYKIETPDLICVIEEIHMSASIEGLFNKLFKNYQSKYKRLKGRTGVGFVAVGPELKWDKVFDK